MKNHRYLSLFIVILMALIAISCSTEGDDAVAVGSLKAVVSESTSKTIEPSRESFAIASYDISGTHKSTSSTFGAKTFTGGSVTVDNLLSGTWSITINGYSASSNKVATCTQDVVIEKDATNTALFKLSLYSLLSASM